MSRLLRATALVLALAIPTLARAQSGATLVAIVTAEPSSPLTRRVRAELQGLGVDVIVLKPPAEGGPSRAPLEQAARGVGAVAAVRLIVSSEGKVEVWVADRVTGKAVVRELDSLGTHASDAAVAVGAVELLRASLLELHTAESAHGEIQATPAVRALALPVQDADTWTPRLGLTASAGVELGVRGLGPSIQGGLAVWVHVVDRFGVRALGSTTLRAASSGTTAGSVEVRAQTLGAAATYDFVEPSRRWVPSMSLGFAAAHVATIGTAVAPFRSTQADGWYAAPMAGASLALTLARGLRVRADALALAALPTVHVRTPTAEAGLWGAPALSISLGLEVSWGTAGQPPPANK